MRVSNVWNGTWNKEIGVHAAIGSVCMDLFMLLLPFLRIILASISKDSFPVGTPVRVVV